MARCYSRNLKQKETSGKEVFESSDTDSDSDDDCGPVMKSGNNQENGAGPSKAPNDMDEDESKSGKQTSASDSDIDVECKPLLDETTGNIIQNMSCFSEDKLPSSFTNEVLTSNSSNNTIIIRSNVQNLEECNRWISEFGDLTNTKWNPRSSRPRGQKITCWKKYVCHRSKFNKVPADENKKGFSKNSGCLANICIRVKLKTSATRKKDSFIKKKGLLAIITIKDVHNHSFNTDLDFLYRSKEKFFKYFSDGMGVAESLKCHMKNGQLDHRGPAFINRYRRRVRRWYDQWRVQNHDKKTEKIIEGDSSSKNADDVNEGAGSSKITVDIGEGASTSKPVGIDGGSLNPNRPVLSLKCLHEDTDDESSSLKVAEDDPSSKFTDVKDVPKLPLNDRDELKHPNLEPVAKNLSTVILVPVYGNIAPQMPVMPLSSSMKELGTHRKCAFCGRRSTKISTITFHRFPKDPELSNKWANISKMKHIIRTPPSVRNNRYLVCSLHFTNDSYKSLMRTRLLPTAIPSREENYFSISINKLREKLNQSLSESRVTSSEDTKESFKKI